MSFPVPAYIEINKINEEDINSVKIDTQAKHPIPYKDWAIRQKPCPVYEVPIEYCRYRKNNGRIKTEILTYEKLKGELIEDEANTQEIISEFLSKSDAKKNSDLKKILKKEGQREPAVMSADGFLINGNRRKWALTELNKEIPDERFKKLKVVILPGTGSPERPTVTDIAILENRFQVNVSGKSEYSKMNKALTYYTHVQSGIPLAELLKDDPTFGDPSSKNFSKKLKFFENEYFEPIKLMNEYLKINSLKGDYNRVANRWMSFEELSTKVTSKLKTEKFLIENNIKANEIGTIKAAAFNIIKVKDSSEVAADNRYLIREIPKWLKKNDLRKDLLKIGEIEDVDENIKDPDERDEKWQAEKSEKIINIIKKLENLTTRIKDQEDPLHRLQEALQKLLHEDLDINQLKGMKIVDIGKALKYCNDIQNANKDLQSFFYHLQKGDETSIESLLKKWNNR